MSADPLTADRLAEIRRLFPVVERYCYLNHAAMAAPPTASQEAVVELARLAGETGDRLWGRRNRRAEEVRESTRRLMGAASPDEIAFVQNTADGLSVVAAGLDWREGDNVVGAACEYPSNVYPWMQLAKRGVEYRQVAERHGRVDPEKLIAALDERTRVLALSWVQFASGFRSDLGRLGRACRERGVLFVVDAIQGLGVLRLDVEALGVDVCAAATHKWVLGAEGLGVLYVSESAADRLRPWRVGWRSVRDIMDWDHFDLTLGRAARRFECGTLNFFGILQLGASLDLLLDIGIEAVEARAMALAQRAAEGLTTRGFQLAHDGPADERSPIVAATHEVRPTAELVRGLEERGVVVAHRGGRLRVSPHFYNTEEEIDRLLGEVDRLL